MSLYKFENIFVCDNAKKKRVRQIFWKNESIYFLMVVFYFCIVLSIKIWIQDGIFIYTKMECWRVSI